MPLAISLLFAGFGDGRVHGLNLALAMRGIAGLGLRGVPAAYALYSSPLSLCNVLLRVIIDECQAYRYVPVTLAKLMRYKT